MKHSLFMGIMIIFTLAMVGAVQGSLTDGLVLYMPFNQSSSNTTFTRDYSGQNNNGTVIGATLTSNHNSYNFVSAGQYIDFGNPSSLNFNNVSFTLSAWIKSTGTDPANGDTILGKRASNGARGYELRLKASGALRLSLREEGGSEKTYETFTTLDKDTWYYVTVVIDQPNNDVLYYIDGKYDRTVSCTNCQTNIGSYGDSFIIGAYGYTGISWNGSLDNIRVYNKLMDATNISLLYSEGHGDNLYISNTGSDSNNGLSEATPLKTISSLNSITNIPGDILSFKSGDFWSERLYFYNESGNKDFPITINSYGSGKIPEIGGRFNLYNTSLANWTLEYYNVYSTQTNTIPYRVWLSGIEYSESVNNNSVNNYDRWYYDSVNDKLYIYATQNPANEYTSFKGVEGVNDFFSSIYIELSDYLIFNNINITGNTPGVYIEGGQNNIFDNVYLGYYSMYSFVTYADIPTYRLSINNSIINSYIDSGYDLKNNYSFNGNDAIKLNEGTNHTIIENNTIIGFGHAGVYIEGISNSANYVEGSSYNIVKNNSIYFNQLTYGRCFGIDGNESQTKNNNITGNRCYNSTIRDQINGNNNEYSYNIISIKNNTEKYTDSKSQGIDFETYSSGVSHDNLIDHNTIYQTCDAGISTRDTVDTPHNHTITNNIIYNSGYCSRSYSDISVFVEVNAGLDYNYSNNLIYKTDLITDTIDYRGTIYNVANWNSADAGGDDIKDNLYTDPLFVGNTLYPNLNTYASNMSTTGSYVGALEPVACIDADGDGFNVSVTDPTCGSAIQLDCDDTNASIHPFDTATTFTASSSFCSGIDTEISATAITINAHNIVIDCNDITIAGDFTDGTFPVSFNAKENITIKNCRFENYTADVWMYGGDTIIDSYFKHRGNFSSRYKQQSIINTTMIFLNNYNNEYGIINGNGNAVEWTFDNVNLTSNSTEFGFHLVNYYDTANLTIINSHINMMGSSSKNELTTIGNIDEIIEQGEFLFENNTLTNSRGLDINGKAVGGKYIIKNNTMSNIVYGISTTNGKKIDYLNIYNNFINCSFTGRFKGTVSNNWCFGMNLDTVNNTDVQRNTIWHYEDKYALTAGLGINDNATIKDNDIYIYGNADGITLGVSYGVEISNNRIYGIINQSGIVVGDSNHSLIENNTIEFVSYPSNTGEAYGISTYLSHLNNTFRNNTIIGAKYGIRVSEDTSNNPGNTYDSNTLTNCIVDVLYNKGENTTFLNNIYSDDEAFYNVVTSNSPIGFTFNSTPSVLKVNLSNGGVWILNHTGRKDKRIEGNKLISPSTESDGYLIGAETITTRTENCTIPYDDFNLNADIVVCDGFRYQINDSGTDGVFIVPNDANGVTLDCNGATFDGDHITNSKFLYVKQANTATLKDCNIYDFYYGFNQESHYKSVDHQIYNNTFNQTLIGVYNFRDRIEIANNTFWNNTWAGLNGDGIQLSGYQNTNYTIDNNYFYYGADAIHITTTAGGAADGVITNNYIGVKALGTTKHGIYLHRIDSITIFGNTLTNGRNSLENDLGLNDSHIYNNTFSNIVNTDGSPYSAIHLTNITNILFEDNTFTNIGQQYCKGCDNTTFLNNVYSEGYANIRLLQDTYPLNASLDEYSSIEHRINISGSYAIFRYNGDKNLQVEGTEIRSNGDLVVNDEFTLICDTYLKLQNNWKFNNVYLQDSCNIYIESGGSLNG